MIENNNLDIIKDRLKGKGIDLSDKEILYELNDGFSISKDRRFICIPVYDEESSAFTGEYCYKPKCYEVFGHYSTFLPHGSMLRNTDVFLVYK